MIKRITLLSPHTFLLFALVLCSAITFAQAPEELNYQAIVRNSAGVPLPQNTTVSIRFLIHDLTQNGALVFDETTKATTDELGGVSIPIGASASLSVVDWNSGPKFLEVLVDITGGQNLVSIGPSQLISVPYAFYAANSAAGPTGSTGATGATGPAGIQGAAGAGGGANGPTGPTGLSGNAGPTGTTGPTGAAGPAGGNPGPAGITGNTGATGTPGPTGPAGANGADGPAGVTGVNGPAGPAGSTGSQGPAGTTGPAAQGTGFLGPQGPTGPSQSPQEVHLTSDFDITASSYTNIPGMSLTFTATRDSAFLYLSASGYGDVPTDGYGGTGGQVYLRVLEGGVSTGGAATRIQSFTENAAGSSYEWVSTWSCGYSKLLTGLTPGNSYTLQVQGYVTDYIIADPDATIYVSSDPNGCHMSLCVFP
jgi:hypothetical protein